MNNVIFEFNILIAGINGLLFFFSLYLHEAARKFFTLKSSLIPENRSILKPDIIGSLLIPVYTLFSYGLIAGYSAVQNNDRAIGVKQYFIATLAAQLFNGLLFVLFIFFAKLLYSFGIFEAENVIPRFIVSLFIYSSVIQLMIITLNFLPIPPLDAGRIASKCLKLKGELADTLGGLAILFLCFMGTAQFLGKHLYRLSHYFITDRGMLFYVIAGAVIIFSVLHYYFFGRMKPYQKTENIPDNEAESFYHKLFLPDKYRLSPDFFKKLENRIKSVPFKNRISGSILIIPKRIKPQNYTEGRNFVENPKEPLNPEKAKDKLLPAKSAYKRLFSPLGFIKMKRTAGLLNRIGSQELLTPNELDEYMKLKNLDLSGVSLCSSERYSFHRESKCRKCRKFVLCGSRLLNETDLRHPVQLKPFISEIH